MAPIPRTLGPSASSAAKNLVKKNKKLYICNTARHSRNQKGTHRRDAEKNKKSNCSAYSAFFAAHLHFRSTDVRFHVLCPVVDRTKTQSSLRLCGEFPVNSPFPS